MDELNKLPLVTEEGCAACPAHHAANLKNLGVSMENFDYVIALGGNPNVGKSTVFNALTGLRQHTGNWPGKTVSRAEGGYSYREANYKIVDLPGAYSLLATSVDEEVARNFILFGRPDVTLIVVDASRLERNLNLALQILEITDRVVVCLNLIDEAERHGLEIDDRRLARDLGVPVVLTSARYGRGMDELLAAVHDVAAGNLRSKPYRIQSEPPELKRAIKKLTGLVAKAYPDLPNARWLALRLLDEDQVIIDAIQSGKITSLVSGLVEVAA